MLHENLETCSDLKNNWKNVKIIFSHNYYVWSLYDILNMHDLKHEQCQMMHHKTLKFSEKWDISSDKHVSDTKHNDYDKPTYLISLEHMKIDLYVVEIPHKLKPMSLCSTINS